MAKQHSYCLGSVQKQQVSQPIAAKCLWKEHVYDFVFMYYSSQDVALHSFVYAVTTIVGLVGRQTSSPALKWPESKTEREAIVAQHCIPLAQVRKSPF